MLVANKHTKIQLIIIKTQFEALSLLLYTDWDNYQIGNSKFGKDVEKLVHRHCQWEQKMVHLLWETIS